MYPKLPINPNCALFLAHRGCISNPTPNLYPYFHPASITHVPSNSKANLFPYPNRSTCTYFYPNPHPYSHANCNIYI